MQRSWLMAQALGIAVHPLGSVPLFLQLLHSPSSPLTAIQSKTLEGIESLWKRRLGLADSESCLLGLRFGYAPQPRYRNPRLPTQTVMTS